MNDNTIHVTNVAAAAARLPGLAGRGNVWSIMARPDIKAGQGGHGRCWPLVPTALEVATDARAAANVARVEAQVNFDDQRSAVAREHDVPELQVTAWIQRQREAPGLVRERDHYFDGAALHMDGVNTCRCRARHPDLKPGDLMAHANGGRGLMLVRPGDTLICGCSADRAKAGRCHRAWAAILLAANGWRVVLDGVMLDLRDPPDNLRGLWPRAETKGRPK